MLVVEQEVLAFIGCEGKKGKEGAKRGLECKLTLETVRVNVLENILESIENRE